MLVSNFEEIFQFEKFPVEYICYQQFLEDIPEDFIYVAIPWTQILNSGWLDFPNKKPFGYYLHELSKMQLPEGRKVTVCQHDDYLNLWPIFKHLGIEVVFSPLQNKHYPESSGIKVLPIPFNCNFDFDNSREKDILVSFVGTPTSHPIRTRMANRIKGDGIIYRSSYHVDSNFFYTENYKKKEEEEFKDVMERSRFSLCPRGSSPSSVRFWESLNAGAIPILISDDWVLPDWDWDNTIVTISEESFEKMTYSDICFILNSIDEEQELMMRNNCTKAASFFDKNRFSEYIKGEL